MSSAIEETVKALVEFESELERAKAGVAEGKRRAVKEALDWAESAKVSAISRATEISTRQVAEAKDQAEAEAKRIREKGESELKAFEGSILRHKPKAAELAASRLLGESK